MDATIFGESNYITADLVNNSESKTAAIVGDSETVDTDYGERLVIPVEIDGKQKSYRPNRDSVKNIITVLGAETKAWIGKELQFSLFSYAGKQCVSAIVKQ